MVKSRMGIGAGLAAVLLACSTEPNEPPPPLITAELLRSYVETLAHDSMQGRASGSAQELATAHYLAAQAERIGLVPRGENGTYLQAVPAVRRSVDEASTTSIHGTPLALFTDYAPGLPATSAPKLTFDGDAVWGGTFTGQYGALPGGLNVAGRVVVVQQATDGGILTSVQPDGSLAGAAAVVFVVNGALSPALISFLRAPRILHGPALRSTLPAPIVLIVTRALGETIMNAPLGALQVGQTGRRVTGNIVVLSSPATIRNVVATLPGSDAAVADEYVALGAHYDHVGMDPSTTATDRVFNGADDNASGTAALLAIAEHFAQPRNRLRRPLAFMWWAAEEIGLVGSEWFSQSPMIPPDDIVAYVNIDMISRGGVTDIPGGGPAYLESIGSRRRSTQLRPLADSVASSHGFQLDYALDAPGHPERVFCRSDQWNLARLGVPVVFFSTGLHPDYHKVTDEPSHSDFTKHARVTVFVAGVTEAIARRPLPLARDIATAGPDAPCVQ